VLLGIGLFVGRAAPRWTGVVAIVGGVMLGVPSVRVQALAGLLLTVSFGSLGLELLRASRGEIHVPAGVGDAGGRPARA